MSFTHELLTLVAAKAVIEALTLRALSPLLATRGLLAAAKTSGTLRTAVAHRLAAIAGRGLASRAAVITWTRLTAELA